MDLSRYLDFISETAYQAGRLTLGYFQTGLQPEWKADHSPVTIADRRSEQFIRARIEQSFPGHAILGEEFGGSEERLDSPGENPRWIIDPIDGTKAFLCGVPLYAVLIGLEIEGQVRVGAAYFPALDELIAAAVGLGCWWNGRRARVSAVPNLSQAAFTTSSIKTFDRLDCREVFDRLCARCYLQAGWGDAYGYLLVATGRVELMLDAAMSVWDCAPFPPILAEAGGFFGDWRGNSTIYAGHSMATTQTLLPEVLEILKQ
jgi:myo-inositol-1(or 4)-monophosphatase